MEPSVSTGSLPHGEPPTFSVIMPAFNAGETLAEALASVSNQTLEEWELVLVDDGSTDTTADIAHSWAQRDPRVHVYRHSDAANHGRPATRNLAAERARGAFLAFLDADDAWHPDALSVYAEAFTRFPATAVVYAQAERIGYGRDVSATLGRGVPESEVDLLAQLARSNVLCTSATAVRRSALPPLPFPLEMKLAQDWACWLELARRSSFVFVPRIVARYRVHESAGTSRMLAGGNRPEYEASQARHLRRLLTSDEPRERSAARAGLRWRATTALQFGLAALRRARFGEARSWLRVARDAVAYPVDLVLALSAVPQAQLRVWRRREHPLHVKAAH